MLELSDSVGFSDVGDLYAAMHTCTKTELFKIRDQGIALGHPGVIARAYDVLGERFPESRLTLQGVTKEDLELALRNAFRYRGSYRDITDGNTAVGLLWQSLYGRDFDRKFLRVPTESVEENIIPLPDAAPWLVDSMLRILVQSKGYTTFVPKNTLRSPSLL